MSDIVTLNGYKIKDEKAVRSYESIVQMKADTKLKEGYHVKTKGYYEANDGGHGEYVIVDDDTLVDDGGLIHVLTNGLRAKLIIDDYITPEMFGAYGDGTHDDTTAIQHAFNSYKNVLLKGYYKCSSNIEILNGHQLTITGTEIVQSGIKFVNGAYMSIGSSTNVNELRMNKFAIVGDLSQDVLLKINYVTNIYMTEVSLSESNGYLMELNHGDIVFIDKCIFAGSNVLGTWWPCKGIKLTSANPIYITNCNIWNLTHFLDILNGNTRTITLLHNWIEFVNIIINCENQRLLNTNLVVNNNNIVWSPHGDNPDFSDGTIVNIDTSPDGFDVLISVKQNHIIFYTDYPIDSLVKISELTGQTNVFIQDNIMFTRLQQVSKYALNLDVKNNTRLYYSSTTNADAPYGCNIGGAIAQNISPNENTMRLLNVSSADTTLLPQTMTDGHIFYNAGGLYIKDLSALKRIPITVREEIADIPTPATATAEEVASKLNVLMAMLRRTNIIK